MYSQYCWMFSFCCSINLENFQSLFLTFPLENINILSVIIIIISIDVYLKRIPALLYFFAQHQPQFSPLSWCQKAFQQSFTSVLPFFIYIYVLLKLQLYPPNFSFNVFFLVSLLLSYASGINVNMFRYRATDKNRTNCLNVCEILEVSHGINFF